MCSDLFLSSPFFGFEARTRVSITTPKKNHTKTRRVFPLLQSRLRRMVNEDAAAVALSRHSVPVPWFGGHSIHIVGGHSTAEITLPGALYTLVSFFLRCQKCRTERSAR